MQSATISPFLSFVFFFNDTATTEIYTLSLHDALPISSTSATRCQSTACAPRPILRRRCSTRSEEHTSELQSRPHLVCRLLLEKKKNMHPIRISRRAAPPLKLATPFASIPSEYVAGTDV